MSRSIKKIRLLPLAALALSLTACDLLPVEETFRAAPVIHEFNQVEYILAACTRGELTLNKTVNCVYIPVRSEGLSFLIGGLRYDEVYVRAGDAVKQGDLVAQAVLDDIVAQIDGLEQQVQSLRLQREQLEQDRALALRRQEVADAYADEKTQKEHIDALNEGYDARREDIDDALTIAQMRLEDQQRRLGERQLRAPIDGTVTYVRRVRTGDLTAVGERVATIADSTLSLFRAETEYWDQFTAGEHYIITSRKVEYEAVVVEPEEVGAPRQEREPGKKGYVYFMLTEPTFELEDSDRGTLILTLDHRDDVLRVPDSAVSTINGQTVVYYQTDDGMRAYKNVVTGLEAEHMVEIIEGLEEGDIVIAG